MTNRGHHLHAESHSPSCRLASCSPITMSLLNSAAKQSTHAFFPRVVRFLVNLGTSMWPCRPWSSYPIADWRTALQFAMLGWSHWNPMHRAKANATKARGQINYTRKSLSTSSNHHFQGAMSRLLVFGNVSPLRFWRLQLQLFGCMPDPKSKKFGSSLIPKGD